VEIPAHTFVPEANWRNTDRKWNEIEGMKDKVGSPSRHETAGRSGRRVVDTGGRGP
jgi:hypothetical protein